MLKNRKINKSVLPDGWMDGWVGGWVDGCKRWVKDCVPAVKNNITLTRVDKK